MSSEDSDKEIVGSAANEAPVADKAVALAAAEDAALAAGEGPDEGEAVARAAAGDSAPAEGEDVVPAATRALKCVMAHAVSCTILARSSFCSTS